MKLQEIVKSFGDSRILVLGDLIVNCYVHGQVSRVSHEAPVPVVDILSQELRTGGAASVVTSIIDMGAKPFVAGVVGDDDCGRWLVEELQRKGANTKGLLLRSDLQTTTKTRIMCNHYQLMRMDYEKKEPIDEGIAEQILIFVKDVVHNVDCVVVSDYDKGAVTGKFLRELTSLCKSEGRILLADARVERIDQSISRHLLDYRGVTALRANDKFAGLSTGITFINETSLRNMGARLISQLECEFVAITRGKEGVSFFDKNGTNMQIPAIETSPKDVTGAGDVFTSTLALSLAAGASAIDATRLSNYVAGLSTGKFRPAGVTPSELIAWLDANT